MTLKKELQKLLNRFSRENISDTPDFILANYLMDSLKAFEAATIEREMFYKIGMRPKKKEL